MESPGRFPYTRGIMADPQPWIMGQYAGFGTAAETNARFRALLAAGVTGFSVALDLPTQLGLDSDHPQAAGEVGKVGVAVSSLADIETLMDGIPLERISQVRTTANSIGYIWAALFTALAEKRNLEPNAFGMFIQNDVLKEFIARGTQIFPPRPSLELAVDVLEHCARHVPRWVPLAMSGYHIREAGATPAQEIAITFSNGVTYLDRALERGVGIDQIAPRLFTFLSVNIAFVEELAKLRAARRVWARLVRARYAPRDPRAEQLRIFVFTAGSSLTAQQPLNNVARTTLETIVAALAGVQTLHVCAYDEALGVPTETAAQLAVRIQQVVQLESGLTDFVDPFGGAPILELETDRIEAEIEGLLTEIDHRGGALSCIENGWFASEIADASWTAQQAIESGERAVVGVNHFRSPPEPLDVFRSDPASERKQIEALSGLRARRNARAVDAALDNLEDDAAGGRNVIPACTAAVRSHATVGEIVNRLRRVHGSWAEGSR